MLVFMLSRYGLCGQFILLIVYFAENNHDRNARFTKAFVALCLQNLHIPTACLAYYLHVSAYLGL